MTAQGRTMVAVALAVLAGVALVALILPAGRDVDRSLMLAWAYDDLIIGPLGAVVSVGFVAAGVAVLAFIAVGRRRPGLAIAVPILVGGATVTTQLLKDDVLGGVVPGSTMPSGHTTVVLSLLLAVLLVAPARWRQWLAAAAGFLGALTGIGTMIGTWHVPGDVAAAAAVCLFWAGLVVLLLSRRSYVGPRDHGTALGRPEVLALVGALSAFAVLAAYRLRLDVDGWLPASRLVGALLAGWIGLVVGWFVRVLDDFVP